MPRAKEPYALGFPKGCPSRNGYRRPLRVRLLAGLATLDFVQSKSAFRPPPPSSLDFIQSGEAFSAILPLFQVSRWKKSTVDRGFRVSRTTRWIKSNIGAASQAQPPERRRASPRKHRIPIYLRKAPFGCPLFHEEKKSSLYLLYETKFIIITKERQVCYFKCGRMHLASLSANRSGSAASSFVNVTRICRSSQSNASSSRPLSPLARRSISIKKFTRSDPSAV